MSIGIPLILGRRGGGGVSAHPTAAHKPFKCDVSLQSTSCKKKYISYKVHVDLGNGENNFITVNSRHIEILELCLDCHKIKQFEAKPKL